jgi:hypothetical protein
VDGERDAGWTTNATRGGRRTRRGANRERVARVW